MDSPSRTSVPEPAREEMPAEPNIGLAVIWSNGREMDDEVESLLRQYFQVLAIYDNRWEEDALERNYERLYCDRRWPGRGHITQKGKGPFRMIVIRDPAPVFDWRMTTQGRAFVNTNFFDAKSRIRRQLANKLGVHISDNNYEGRRDIAMMLGLDQLEKFEKQTLRGATEPIHATLSRNTSGFEGWDSLQEMFSLLNEASMYVVLNAPVDSSSNGSARSQTIHLLTDDYYTVINALNASPGGRIVSPYGGRFSVIVGGRTTSVTIRYVGDSYLPDKLATRALENRRLGPDGAYRLASEDLVAITAYRIVFLEDSHSDKSPQALNRLVEGRTTDDYEAFHDHDEVCQFVHEMIERMGCPRAPIPLDPAVRFNYAAAGYGFSYYRQAARHLRTTVVMSALYAEDSYRWGRRVLADGLPWVSSVRRSFRKTVKRYSRHRAGRDSKVDAE